MAENPQIESESFHRFVLTLQGAFNCLDDARMPVLAAIQGGCIGGAVDMTSACDIRYCTADAFFQIQEINIGMTADVGTFPRLCKLIPEGWVRELAYTGRRLPAQKALQIGLVNEVYPGHAAMMSAVMATAREIASKAPLAVSGSKMMINYARDHTIAEGLDRIAIWQAGMHSRTSMAEAFRANAEKRPGRFPDLARLRKSI
jgi:enoyl-CoA hydratase